MIIVTAQDLSQFLNYITFYAQSLMRDEDTIQDIILGFEDLLSLVDDRRKVSDDDAFRILGFDNQARGLSSLIASYFRRSTKIEFLNLILDIIKIYNKYDDFLSSGGSQILSKVENLINKESVILDVPEPLQEIVFKEEIPEEEDTIESGLSPEKRSSWYVTSGEKFSTTTSFYGPFSTNLSAIVFSILIHRPGFAEEGSVLTGDKVLAILRMADKRIVDLDSAKDIHGAAVVNEVLPGRIKSASLEYTRGEYELELSTSGDIFDSFLEFMKESANFPQDATISFQEVVSWINSDAPLTFPNFYFEKTGNYDVSHDAPQEFDKIDPAIPETSEIKTDLSTAPTEPEKFVEVTPAESIRSNTEAIQNFNLPITSPSDPELLSDAFIMEYFQKIKSEIISFNELSNESISSNYSVYFINLQNLLKVISDKDFKTKSNLKSFREKNKLEISSDINYEWEFRQRFSILSKILLDTVLFGNLASAIGKLVTQKMFSDPKSDAYNIISGAVYKARKEIISEEANDIKSAISEITISSQEEILKIVYLELKKTIKSFVDSAGLFSWETDGILDRLISNIGIRAIARNKAKEYFSNKERIISSQKFYTIQCGVCSQHTQIPEQYKDFIEKFSVENKQYSFFRTDGSIITEDELRGGNTPKSYSLSSEMLSLIEDYVKAAVGSSLSKSLRSIANRQFTWEEVNLMISSPQSLDSNAANQIQQNIFGLMIRNDILKNYFDAVPAGRKGIFPGRSLCAGSLLGLQEDIKASDTSKKFLENRQNYRCNAAIAANYSAVVESPKYQSSAYISPNGNIAAKDEVDTYFIPGFRFSRWEIKCPCHIGSNSELLDVAVGKKTYKNIFEGIAIPNIPQSMVNDISSKFTVDPSLIYHPPTTPDGDLARDLSQAGYVVCAKKVSLSMFDRDPSSRNYIRNVLSKSLSSGGPRELMSLVNALINHGVEMNDLKPHVESVVSAGTATKLAKKKILRDLFNSVKISLAQSSFEPQESVIKDIGLVCEHGHRFTVGQSWEFARTHAAIRPYGRVSARALIMSPVSLKDIISLAKASPEDSMKMMLTNPSEKETGFGAFEVGLNEEELKKSGFKQPGDASSSEELISLIKKKLIYFKSDDGKIYKLADSIQKGALVKSPWIPDSINRITQTSVEMNLYAGAMEGLTRKSEDGGEYERDLEDASASAEYYKGSYDSERDEDQDEDDDRYHRATRNATFDFNLAKALLPEITQETLSSYELNPEKSANTNEQSFIALSDEFIGKFITALKLSRIWGIMAADYNLDFLRDPTSFPKSDPELKGKIEAVLKSLLSSIGIIESQHSSIINSFFRSYDVLGLVSRSVTQDVFFSLAAIKQYYLGFYPPNIINLSNKEAKDQVFRALALAVRENLPAILKIQSLDADTDKMISSASDALATYLLSPYEKCNYKMLFENAIVDYSGRAMIFSYSFNIIDKIKSFYSKFFFNEQSPLYIGSYRSNEPAIRTIENLLSSTSEGGTPIPNILRINESDFLNEITRLKDELETMHSTNFLQEGYLKARNIPLADIQNDEDKFYIQLSIVISKYIKSVKLAIDSMDIIFNDLAGKSMGDPSIKRGAKVLDVVIENFMKERDPQYFEQNKERITKSRERYGELSSSFSEGIFSTNAVVSARINLSSENESLDSIMSTEVSFGICELKQESLTGVDSGARFSPKLVLLRKIRINREATTERTKELYLCLVPFETDFVGSDLLNKKVDIINYLDPKKFIRLDSPQGREFSSRYLSGFQDLDYSRLVIFNSEYSKYSSSGRLEDKVTEFASKNFKFEVRVSKIDKPISFWPPQKSLLFEDRNVMSSYDPYRGNNQSRDSVEEVNIFYEKLLYGKDPSSKRPVGHSDFIKNLENFNTSKTSASPDVNSSHGVIIPLKGSEEEKRAARISPHSSYEKISSLKNLISISKSEIYINLDSGKKLNISWAFKALDPQILDDNKQVKHILVQSGIVQKMDYISKQMKSIYTYVKEYRDQVLKESNIDVFRKISDQNSSATIDFSNFNRFLDTFFSSLSPLVRISAYLDSGLPKASLEIKEINFSAFLNSSKYNREYIISNLSELVDYYNASQTLNSMYLNLQPTIVVANCKNIKTNADGKSIAMKLLDPYSLWMMVSNPAMSTRFGGPINPEDADDYKSFIMETFGLEDVVRGVIRETGIDSSKFREEDLFDLAGFYNKYSSEVTPTTAESLRKFAKLFKLDVDSSGARTYLNGYPISIGDSVPMRDIISSARTSNFILDQSSYIEHPYKLGTSLSDIPESTISKLREDIKKNILGNQDLISELESGISKNLSNERRKEILDSKIETLISEQMSKRDEIENIRAKNRRIQSGQDAPTLKDLDALARGYGFQRKDSPLTYNDLLKLTEEINSGLGIRGIVSNVFNRKEKTAGKLISWRKIAQSVTDEESTIIRSLYHKWWEQYLNIMAKMAS